MQVRSPLPDRPLVMTFLLFRALHLWTTNPPWYFCCTPSAEVFLWTGVAFEYSIHSTRGHLNALWARC